MTFLPVVTGVSIRLIKDLVARHYGLPLEAMTSPERSRDFAWPRQMAMSLSREFTTKSLVTIGRHFGGRDHTTVIHACRAIELRSAYLEYVAADRAVLRAVLAQIAPKRAEVNMPEVLAELGLAPGASVDEIKAAHRRKVREHHPDAGGDGEKFRTVTEAYRTMMDLAA